MRYKDFHEMTYTSYSHDRHKPHNLHIALSFKVKTERKQFIKFVKDSLDRIALPEIRLSSNWGEDFPHGVGISICFKSKTAQRKFLSEIKKVLYNG